MVRLSPFRRYVEIGRVCLVNYGPDKGKLCVIVDVVDGNRAYVDGPVCCTGVSRQIINFKRLALTDFTVSISRGARLSTLRKAFSEAKIEEKWAATAWAKKLEAKKARDNTSDFERFQIMKAKKHRSALVKAAAKKLK
eukprot:CAMPEP_0205826090 /NCGR_PEP_ID=MMETSP0206-20130828/27614_1 /ASSEMBLY_ACC=CAM_ASM_000279 /TAXON_ID=36767 /ORGANISM="Euplotes focardii, Strain TN1" /LENGTH=137 /DNA_ID=CAMNT_0053125739 /DNA_START=37 /DNA_END=450 /DNA_ORIENTATION=+